jgi:signal peptidase I
MIYSVAIGVLPGVLLAGAWTLRRRISIVTVSGLSMLPTYVAGDRLLVRRASIDRLQVGQVVVFEQPDASGGWAAPARSPGAGRGWMIKRVAALPGDRWPAISWPLEQPSGGHDRGRVPADRLVVTGDNPAVSYDSRKFGYVPADRLFGVVVRQLERGSTSTDRSRRAWPRPSAAACAETACGSVRPAAGHDRALP